MQYTDAWNSRRIGEKKKIVCWNEYTEEDGHSIAWIDCREAIASMKHLGAMKGDFTYHDDEIALEDFAVINWGWIDYADE